VGTGEIRLRALAKRTLRMRPSRLVIGEVRAEECLDLLLALNAGLPWRATCAHSARAALMNICARCRGSQATTGQRVVHSGLSARLGGRVSDNFRVVQRRCAVAAKT
jgi:Flp pilus assembly CpaF family ATPase